MKTLFSTLPSTSPSSVRLNQSVRLHSFLSRILSSSINCCRAKTDVITMRDPINLSPPLEGSRDDMTLEPKLERLFPPMKPLIAAEILEKPNQIGGISNDQIPNFGRAPITNKNRHLNEINQLLSALKPNSKANIMLLGVGDINFTVSGQVPGIRSPQVWELVRDIPKSILHTDLTLVDIGKVILNAATDNAHMQARLTDKRLTLHAHQADLTEYNFPHQTLDLMVATHVIHYPMLEMAKAEKPKEDFIKFSKAILGSLKTGSQGILCDASSVAYMSYAFGKFENYSESYHNLSGGKGANDWNKNIQSINENFSNTCGRPVELIALLQKNNSYPMFNIRFP